MIYITSKVFGFFKVWQMINVIILKQLVRETLLNFNDRI